MGFGGWVITVFVLIAIIAVGAISAKLYRKSYKIFQDTYGFWVKKTKLYIVFGFIKWFETETIQESAGTYVDGSGHTQTRYKTRYFKTQEEVDAWVTKDKNESVLVKEFTYTDNT